MCQSWECAIGWELLWLGLSLGVAYLLAVSFGDRILQHAAEHRRLADWKRVGGLIQWRLHLALVRTFAAGLQAALPKVSTGVPSGGYFKQWTYMIEEVLGRSQKRGRVMITDLRHDDDHVLVVRLAHLLPVVKMAHRELYALMVGFQDSIPTQLRQALALAVLRLFEFSESVKELSHDYMKQDADAVGIQIHQNCTLSKDLFVALDELLSELGAALTKDQRRAIDLRNTERSGA